MGLPETLWRNLISFLFISDWSPLLQNPSSYEFFSLNPFLNCQVQLWNLELLFLLLKYLSYYCYLLKSKNFQGISELYQKSVLRSWSAHSLSNKVLSILEFSLIIFSNYQFFFRMFCERFEWIYYFHFQTALDLHYYWVYYYFNLTCLKYTWFSFHVL